MEILKALATSLEVDETKVAEVIKSLNVEVLTKDERTQLETNLKKLAYNEGKTAEKEMTLKNLKKAKGLEIEAYSIEELFDKHSEIIKSQFTGDVDLKLKEKDAVIGKLQKTVQEKESEFENFKKVESKKVKDVKADFIIQQEISKIAIEVPTQISALGEKEVDKYIEQKQKQNSLLFKSQFILEFDENGNEIYYDSQGNLLVDNVQNPLKRSDVMTKFAKDYYLTIPTVQRQGRGGSSSSFNTSGENFKGMSEVEFFKVMKSKGIENGTSAIQPYFLKWKEANKN